MYKEDGLKFVWENGRIVQRTNELINLLISIQIYYATKMIYLNVGHFTLQL
jgi:hypothetical protein